MSDESKGCFVKYECMLKEVKNMLKIVIVAAVVIVVAVVAVVIIKSKKK